MFRTSLVIIGALSIAAPLFAQSLDDAAVAAAIQAGATKKADRLAASCSATPGFGGMMANLAGGIQPTGSYSVRMSGASGRIALLTADAKRLYKPFSIQDVTDTMRDTSLIFVTVDPNQPYRNQDTLEVASPIDGVVLKSKVDPNRVVQPKDIQFTATQWANLVGGKVDGNAALVTFAASDVRELPPGDFDVVVISKAGERRCKMNSKDRALLFNTEMITSRK